MIRITGWTPLHFMPGVDMESKVYKKEGFRSLLFHIKCALLHDYQLTEEVNDKDDWGSELKPSREELK